MSPRIQQQLNYTHKLLKWIGQGLMFMRELNWAQLKGSKTPLSLCLFSQMIKAERLLVVVIQSHDSITRFYCEANNNGNNKTTLIRIVRHHKNSSINIIYSQWWTVVLRSFEIQLSKLHTSDFRHVSDYILYFGGTFL